MKIHDQKIAVHALRPTRPLRLAGVVLASSVAWMGLPLPAGAADTPAAQTGAAQSTPHEAQHGVDGLIDHLHSELKITPAQESQFQKLAEVMRSNAENMRALAKKRAEASGSASAVDDLKSYAEISRAHAEDAEKMVAVFQGLYDSMSAEQKKVADQEFRNHYATHHHRHAQPGS